MRRLEAMTWSRNWIVQEDSQAVDLAQYETNYLATMNINDSYAKYLHPSIVPSGLVLAIDVDVCGLAHGLEYDQSLILGFLASCNSIRSGYLSIFSVHRVQSDVKAAAFRTCPKNILEMMNAAMNIGDSATAATKSSFSPYHQIYHASRYRRAVAPNVEQHLFFHLARCYLCRPQSQHQSQPAAFPRRPDAEVHYRHDHKRADTL